VRSQLPVEYTKKDVENARTKGQIFGWVQGGAVAVAGMILLGFIGWIPTVAVLGVGGYAVFRLLTRSRRDSRPPPDST
jgi:hypothetical protein